MEAVDRPDRDSHDLTIAAARFSVVDSMLLSLSGLPNSPTTGLHDSRLQFPDPDLDDLYNISPKRGLSSNTGRRRGHTQSSSASDYDTHVDDLASRYTIYHSRNRQDGVTALPRRNTKGENGRIANGIIAGAPVDVFDDGVMGKENMPRHARGTGVKGSKGSKGSGSSSVDLGPGFGFRSAYGHGPSRAASFDQSFGSRELRGSPLKPPHGGTLEKAKSHSVFDYGGLDAAPMPTVPAGPRRPQEPLSPVLVNSPPLIPKKVAPSRKNSIKSNAGKGTNKPKAATMDPAIRDQARQFVQASNQLRSVHASNQHNSPAPAPTVGAPRRQMFPPAPASKERQGFFRRFFGSSKDKEEERRPPSPPLIPHPSSSSHRPKTQPNSQHIATQLKSASRPPTQDASCSSRDGPPHPTLKKTHSSFFRRRKKSMSENGPPPMPPLQLQPPAAMKSEKLVPVLSARPLSAGLNSLRKAMDPYLHDAKTSPMETYFDSRENQSPIVDEAALAVNGERDLETHRLSPAPGRTRDHIRQRPLSQAANAQSLNPEGGDTSNLNLNFSNAPENVSNTSSAMKCGRVGLVSDNERSFLHDSSTNEDGRTSSSNPSPPAPHNRNSIPPPTRAAPTSAPYSQLPLNGVASRKANIGEKRLEVLSPLSDRSQIVAGPERSHLDDADEDDSFVVSDPREGSLKSHSSNRLWLDASSSEEKFNDAGLLTLPLEGPRTSEKNSPVSPTSENEVFASANSSPLVQMDSNKDILSEWADTDGAKAILASDTDITPDDRERARQIFDGEETFVAKAEAAAWLGQTSPKSTRTRRAYMQLYDWYGYNILAAFRQLCSKLVVKAESQQLDRVIDAFADRWCACNPNHGFKDRDVVHTITYSVLMLNTDLHVADLEQRMTRSQFVKNTLPTIRSIADAAALTAANNADRAASRQSTLRANGWEQPGSPLSPVFPSDGRTSEDARERPSFEFKRSLNRLSVRPTARKDSDNPFDAAPGDSCNVLVKAPYEGGMKGWEFQVEIVLKEFYNSIRQQRLPLHGVPENVGNKIVTEQPSTTSLSVVTNALRRTPSVLSKAPSDNISYRGRSSEYRTMTGRFGAKNRSRPRVYPTSTVGSSRTSLDDQSVFSPAASTWSKYSFGKTQTSLSGDSFGTNFGQGDYQQAIGFANALSQAIIREESGKLEASSEEYAGRTVPLLEDETLELAGPPWAKEGLLKHRHHLESLEKKAKDRGWNECFVVVEKGWMRLFSFNQQSKSLRHRMKNRQASGQSHSGGVVGGGNWTENAEAIGVFLLRQTIASALPSPGYSKSRPYVFALSLPTGAVHLFSVGTAEIVKEFVIAANYWSARLSKEPLVGGISNIEYGWSEMTLSAAASASRSPSQGGDGTATGRNGSISLGRGSISGPLQSPGISHSASHSHSSISRSSFDQSGHRRLPGDRVMISDWQPPTQSMMASNLMEVDQLRALTAYVQSVEEELKKHNELRGMMASAYSPRSSNAGKAMANWEKKSAYLLREIVKFKTYTDALTAAQTRKEEIYKEREECEKANEEKEKEKNKENEVNGASKAEAATNGTACVHTAAQLSENRRNSIQQGAPIIRTERPSIDFNDGDSDGDMDEATMEAIKVSRNASPLGFDGR